MRLPILIATGLCILLPGCQLFSPIFERSEHHTHQKKRDKGQRSGHHVAELSEPIEDLAFEEDASDLMDIPDDGQTLDLIEDPTLATEQQSREVQQARYGFKPIYFRFDEYEIPEEQYDTLKRDVKAIKILTKRIGKKIVIEGHADCYAGSHDYNMHLSEKRAQAVKSYLVKQGVSGDQLIVVGRGATMCIVPSGDKNQQAPNRRVEFYVLHEQ